jgi:hypothetical protein
MITQAFLQEGRAEQACRWNGLALALAPRNEQYLKFKRDQRCDS